MRCRFEIQDCTKTHPDVDDLPVLVENVFQVVLVGGGVHVSAENVRCVADGGERGARTGPRVSTTM